MSTGILPQLIMMLMMLWLPAKPTGRPAPAATILRYVPADASVVATVDAGSLLSAALDGFKDLGQQPFVKGVPPVAAAYAKMSRQLNMGLRMITGVTGIDLNKDVRYITISLANSGRRSPEWVVAMGGNFRPDAVERFAAANKSQPGQKLAGGTLYDAPRPGKPAMALTGDGVLLVGEPPLVQQLLKRRPRPGALARLVKPLHDGSTVIAVAARSDKELMRQLQRKLEPPFRALGAGLAGVYVGLRYDGTRVALQAKQGRMLPRYQKLLDGMGSYLAAAELLLHGSLEALDGVLDAGDKGLPRELAALARQKPDLLRYIKGRLPKVRTSHRVAVQRGARVVRLDYRGSRVAGVLPLGMVAGAALGR